MSDKMKIFHRKKFYKDQNGYYYGMIGIHAHRWVWINHFGAIPLGMDIHHKDGNKENNEIDNLELLSRSDHLKRHWQEGRFDLNQRREQLKEARKWLSTPEGREKQSKDAIEGWKKRKSIIYNCKACNKENETKHNKSLFCSAACRSRWKRHNKPNPIEFLCPICNIKYLKDKTDKKVCCSRSCAAKYRPNS